jgi:hypothetical protein
MLMCSSMINDVDYDVSCFHWVEGGEVAFVNYTDVLTDGLGTLLCVVNWVAASVVRTYV